MSAPRPIPVVVHGAAGRMGREVAAIVRDDPALRLARAIDAPGHEGTGSPLVDARGRGGPPALDAEVGVLPEGCVVIDFSAPAALRSLLAALAAQPRPLVTGTTGLGTEDEEALDSLARVVPVLHSPNMSLGVAAVRAACARLAAALGDGFDVEVLEIHHSAKKDSPSGTALALAETLARARPGAAGVVFRTPAGTGADAASVAGRFRTSASPRSAGEIGLAALRGGAVVGDHTVYFLGADERIEITHRAMGRSLFARGAVRVAKWLVSQHPGRHTIDAVLG